MSDETGKKPMLQALFDMLEKLGKPRYNPSGFHTPAMNAEDDARRQKIATLLEFLGRTAIPNRQRKITIKRLREAMGRCAFPGVGYLEVIKSLELEEKEGNK